MGVAILIVAVVASLAAIVVIDQVTHDKYHLVPAIIKTIHDSTPGGTAQDITSVFIWMAVAFGIAAYVLPTISQRCKQSTGQRGIEGR